MFDTASIIKRAVDKGGFQRIRFHEKNIPTSFSDVSVMSFFGDMRSTFILSSLLLRRYREEVKGSKYFILLSWPGYESLFPYVDEYWTIDEQSAIALWNEAKGFSNQSNMDVLCKKHLNHFFDDRIDSEVFKQYYDQGLLKEFFDRFKHINCYLPGVPSAVSAGPDINRALAQRPGLKVFVYPTKTMFGWGYGKERTLRVTKEFWLELCKQLVDRGFCPVVYRDAYAYDLSVELTTECVHFRELDLAKVLSVMRATGCVLDVFSDISRLAIAARCPFVEVVERQRYDKIKEYEIDDLCALYLPKEYIFSFSTIIEGQDRNVWKSNLYDLIIARLNNFLPSLDRNSWPSTTEFYDLVLYETVRKYKSKKLGTRFVKVENI
jgi:hypothetical protein